MMLDTPEGYLGIPAEWRLRVLLYYSILDIEVACRWIKRLVELSKLSVRLLNIAF